MPFLLILLSSNALSVNRSRDEEFGKHFDVSSLRYPAIFLFRNGKYEIYNGTKVSKEIITFAQSYKDTILKAIPEKKSQTELIWDDIKRNSVPFIYFIDSIGLKILPDYLKAMLVITLLLLPLLVTFCLCWWKEEEAEDYSFLGQASPARSEGDKDDSLYRQLYGNSSNNNSQNDSGFPETRAVPSK